MSNNGSALSVPKNLLWANQVCLSLTLLLPLQRQPLIILTDIEWHRQVLPIITNISRL